MSEQMVTISTANALYQEGGDYMKHRTIQILEAELERHRKGSSGYATVEHLLEKVLELQSVT
jgi:hypothetical protein